MVKWPLLIISTKFFRLSTWNQEKMFWSHGLLVNLTVFTNPTMRFSHGLMVKWPLYIIFTKFFRKSTWNQEKIDDLMFSQWDQEIPPVLLVNLTVFTHPTMRFFYSLMVKLSLWIIFTKFFRLSTCNKEKIWWSHVFIFSQWGHEMSHSLLVNLSVFTHPTMRFRMASWWNDNYEYHSQNSSD